MVAGASGGMKAEDQGALYQLKMKSSEQQTLRVLTVSIGDMKQWAAYKNQLGTVIFEVFGTPCALCTHQYW